MQLLNTIAHKRVPEGLPITPRWSSGGPQRLQICCSAIVSPPQLGVQFNHLSAIVAPDALVIADATPLGRGLLPTTPMSAGDVVLSVDWANLLCVTDTPETGTAFSSRVFQDWQLLHGPLPPLLLNMLLDKSFTWAMRMTAWLLWLKRNAIGAWRMYIEILPNEGEFPSLMHFKKEEVEMLQERGLMTLANKERQLVARLHETVFSSQTGQLAALDLAPRPEDTFWALSMVNSRSFSETVEGEVVSLMVPCADMANHVAFPNCEYAYDTLDDSFQLKANQDIALGEEICISYGCTGKSNAELMKDYGFVIPGNVNDRIPFITGDDILSQLQAKQTVTHTKPSIHAAHFMAALGIQGASTGSQFDLLGDYAFPVLMSDQNNEELVLKRRKVGLLMSLQPFLRELPRRQQSLGLVALTGKELEREKTSVEGLRKQVKGMLSGFPTTVNQDEEILEDKNKSCLTVCGQQAVVARKEIKLGLQSALGFFDIYTTYLGS